MINIQKQQGFTLIELLTVVAIMGIMAGMAYPSLTRFANNTRTLNRIDQTANLFRFAKSEAVRLNVPVIVCGTGIKSDGRAEGICDPKKYSKGLMAFADSNRNGRKDPDEPEIRTVSLNGNRPDNKPIVSVDVQQCGHLNNNNQFARACGPIAPYAPKDVGGTNAQQLVFMPNGSLGIKYQPDGYTRVSFSSNFVRFILSSPDDEKKLHARILIVHPLSRVSTCLNGSRTNDPSLFAGLCSVSTK